MAVLIPVDSSGNRTILADNLPGGPRRFRTYFSQGEQDGWYLDIFDSAGNVLIRGIRCVPGCPNLVKGQGDDFAGEQLACVVLRGSETAPDA
ncbi:MAG: hypothetical protein LBU64_06420, partial [Planctomycetota bacterium]|nr:hypothetical protein [Planctomycetota bacterium]